jgi:hypothetical protein
MFIRQAARTNLTARIIPFSTALIKCQIRGVFFFSNIWLLLTTYILYCGAKYTVIRFVSTSAKFGICIAVGLNGTLVEDKILDPTSVPISTHDAAQMPNLTLT